MRPFALLAAVPLLALAACGGGDDDATADAATAEPTGGGDSGTVADATGDGSTTTAVVVTVAPGVCEDEPDPADYPEGAIPPAIPPCEQPEELVVHTIRPGMGRTAEDGNTVIVDYTGMRSEDGLVFDSSYTRAAPLDFPLGRGSVIRGWDEGLAGAQAGSLLKLDIPTELAYGDQPPGDDIQPGDDLSFVIEVRAVVPSVTADDAPLDLGLEPSVGATEVTTEDRVVGDGAVVEAGDTAIVHVLLVRGDNEVVLLNTWERDDPLQIVIDEGGSLPGIVEGLEGATVGTLRVIRMPPESAFGPDGEVGLGLPPDTDLIVVAEVVGVY